MLRGWPLGLLHIRVPARSDHVQHEEQMGCHIPKYSMFKATEVQTQNLTFTNNSASYTKNGGADRNPLASPWVPHWLLGSIGGNSLRATPHLGDGRGSILSTVWIISEMSARVHVQISRSILHFNSCTLLTKGILCHHEAHQGRWDTLPGNHLACWTTPFCLTDNSTGW